MILVLILHAIMKKLVQNNFYQKQLINNISFEKKRDSHTYYDQLVNLILCQQ